jgi:hypothetical protein
MKKPPILTAIILCCMSLFYAIVPMGCANIIPPSGGPRDSIPPVLIEASPGDSTVNFRGKRITLYFNEYVDLKDVANNLYFTPTFTINPAITVKGKSIVIPFRDSLLPNTTYVLNFGNAIADVNEGNVLRDYTYTFSTGPVLDSLEITGKVILAETGGLDTTLMAVLYRDFSDSAVVQKKAPSIAKLNSQGVFRFRNLPADSFAVYVLGGQGKDRRYQNRSELFAFANGAVHAGQADSLVLYAYREQPPRTSTSNTRRSTADDQRLKFTLNTTGQQDLLQDLVLNFTVPLSEFDSTKIQLTTDSLFNPVDFSASMDTSRKSVIIKTAWKEKTNYNLVLDKEFAKDTAGRQLLKTDTLFFTTKELADYGNINIRIRNLDLEQNPVLQFVKNNAVVFSVPVKEGVFNKDLFEPGEYNLRILYDLDGDGKWTPGNFTAKKQPEIVIPIERTITIRTAYNNEFDIPL